MLCYVRAVIMWCADKMPSFTGKVEGANADECVKKAQDLDTSISDAEKARAALITKYKK